MLFGHHLRIHESQRVRELARVSSGDAAKSSSAWLHIWEDDRKWAEMMANKIGVKCNLKTGVREDKKELADG